jgi:hypothetical protein
MCKKFMIAIMIVVFLSILATEIPAMTDVLMNSAETITPGNFKLGLYPFALLSKNGSGSDFGIAARAGLGLTRGIDVELKGAYIENVSYFGADIEFWFLRGRNLNASVTLGGHLINSKNGNDCSGFDAAFMASTAPVRRLEIYGAVKFAFDSVKDTNQNYTLVHIVPGLEYRISRKIDLLAEFGVGLNDNSRSYISAGLAFYSRR